MKKQLLCTLAFCSALGTAQAQTDVTGEYLVNPSFETLKAADGTTGVAAGQDLGNGLYGWDIPSADQSPNTGYYNRRVESQTSGSGSGFGSGIVPNDGTYYYYNRQGWGTFDAELKTTTTRELPAGNYYVVIDYKAASFSNNGDASAAQTGIGIKASDAAGVILGENPRTQRCFSVVQNEGNLTSTHFVDADWDQVGAMFTVTTPTAVTFTVMEHMTGSHGRGDIILDNMKLYKIDEIPAEGMDVSGLISNYNDYALAGWTTTSSDKFISQTGSPGEDGSGLTSPFIESWVAQGTLADADLSYTLNNLPSGIYEVSGFIRVKNQAGAANPVAGATLYANGGTTDACTGTACTDGQGVYGTYAVQGIVSTDGVLKFGVQLANTNFNWICFKDFTLKYLGESGLEDLKASLTTLIRQAQAKIADCPTAVAAIVNAAITQGNSALKGSDSEAMNTAIDALNAAIALAEAVIPTANELEAAIAQNQSVLKHSTANNDETATAYQSAIQSAQKALDEATEVTAITEAIASLEAARQTYVQNAVPEEGYPFDYNFLVEEVGNSTSGWTKSTNGPDFTYDAGKTDKNNGEYQKTGYIACWSGSNYSGTYTYTFTDLPNGHYKISAYAFTSTGKQAAFIANTQSVTLANEHNLYTQPVIEDVKVWDGKLTFGLDIISSSWVGITNIQLQYLSALTDEDYIALAKETLQTALEAAGEVDIETNVGNEAFQIPQALADAVTQAIASGMETAGKADATLEELESATEALNAAVAAFQAPELNAPETGELFCIVNQTSSFGYKNNALSPRFSTGKVGDGDYDLKWMHIVDANYAQSFKFTPVEGQKNQYTISFTDENGETRYLSTQALAGYMDGNSTSTRNDRIRVTTESDKALPVEVRLAGDGIYNLRNTRHSSNFGSTGNDDLFSTYSNSTLMIVKAEEAQVTLTVTKAGWATLILPFDAEVPNGLKAYTSAGAEATETAGESLLTLEEAATLEANTPYIIEGTPGTYNFSGYGLATQDTYGNDFMTGTLVAKEAAEAGTYVLQNQNGKVGFFKVGDTAETQPAIPAYRAYLDAAASTSEANARVFILRSIDGDGSTTGISNTVADKDTPVDVYSLNGVLLRKGVKMGEALNGLQKGIYIVNGTKKAVK